MKKVYVAPEIVVRNVKMARFMVNQLSGARTNGALNTDNRKFEYNGIDVSNDTGSEIWNNDGLSGEFM